MERTFTMKKLLQTLSLPAFAKRAAAAKAVTAKAVTLALVCAALSLTACDSPVSTPPGNGNVLTAAIGFQTTADNSAGTVRDTASTETAWTLNVTEENVAYFAVSKTADQSIAISGTDASLVTQAASGEVVDGSTAGPELALFTVNAAATDMEKYFGVSRAFTLTVSEEGKDNRAVNVTLKVNPDVTTGGGFAIFQVTREAGDTGVTPAMTTDVNISAAEMEAWALRGTLTPVTGGKKWQMGTIILESTWVYTDGSFSAEDGDSLLDALAWLDRHVTADDQEYLLRLAKDGELPRTELLCHGYNNVTVRLRGAGGERTIRYDMSDPSTTLYQEKTSTLVGRPTGSVMGWIHLGGPTTTANQATGKRVVLSLEKDVTLDFSGVSDVTEASPYLGTGQKTLRRMVSVDLNSLFVMLDGSKITGYSLEGDHDSASHPGIDYYDYVILRETFAVNGMTSGRFYMFGGAITGNTVPWGLINVGSTADFNTANRSNGAKFFVKKGGSITGNFFIADWTYEKTSGNRIWNSTGELLLVDNSAEYAFPLFPNE
jgi:hypothetical protein